MAHNAQGITLYSTLQVKRSCSHPIPVGVQAYTYDGMGSKRHGWNHDVRVLRI